MTIVLKTWKNPYFQYIPKTENRYRYDFGIYRNFKIHTGIFSVYTETSKSIPIFFRYIPKPQNPYRYFLGIYRNLKNHTDIFRYIPYRKIPVFFGIGMVFVQHYILPLEKIIIFVLVKLTVKPQSLQ